MPVKPFKFQSGKPRDEIKKYRKDIETNIIPKLEQEYGVKFNPPREQTTMLTYNAKKDNYGFIEVQFSTNNAKQNHDGVFVTVYDNGTHGGEDVGVVDVKDSENTVQSIIDVWNSLDVLTLADAEEEKQRKEQEQQEADEKQRKEAEERKARIKQEIEEQEPEKSEEELQKEKEEQEKLEAEQFQKDLESFNNDFKNAHDQLMRMNDMGAYIMNEFVVLKSSDEDKESYSSVQVSVQEQYITNTVCILNTEHLKPAKNNEQVTWDYAKGYVNKVVDKLKQIPIITLYDSKGKQLKVEDPNETSSNDIEINY